MKQRPVNAFNLRLTPRAGKEEDASRCHVLCIQKPHGLRRRRSERARERERERKNEMNSLNSYAARATDSAELQGDTKQVERNFRLVVVRRHTQKEIPFPNPWLRRDVLLTLLLLRCFLLRRPLVV